MSVKLIYARSLNNVIGFKNKLPWHLSADLKYFKQKTLNQIVVMGRGTWESLPDKYRPLPDRTNIVLSRNPEYQCQGALVRSSLEEVVKEFPNQTLWVIGGEQLFKIAIDLADELFVTLIHEFYLGDAFAPTVDPDIWTLTDSSPLSEENGLHYVFQHYRRF